MADHATWLHVQIHSWVSDGIIGQETGAALKQRYPLATNKSRNVSLLTIIGAGVFGLGVILFFAFNWSELSKAIKLSLIFAALLASHGIALILRKGRDNPSTLVEGFHFMGTMMFGAGIWLIAQIYHIDEHYPLAFLLWGVGALVFAWVVPSIFQALLACLLILVWGISEVTDFAQTNLYSLALIIFGVLPLAWIHRSRTLLLLSLLSLIVLSLLNAHDHLNFSAVFYLLVALSLLMIAASYWADNSPFGGSGSVLRLMGVPVYASCLFAMTFFENTDLMDIVLSEQADLHRISLITIWSILIAASLAWVGIFVSGVFRKTATFTTTYKCQQLLILLSLTLLMLQASSLLNAVDGDYVYWHYSTLTYNAIIIAHCVLLIIRGTDNLNWKLVAMGCIALASLLLVRFNDLFHSLLLRSLVFLLLGATLFLIGHLYARRRMKIQNLQVTTDA